MAPRWEGGYGFQVRNEFSTTHKMMEGSDEVANLDDVERTVNTMWLEGVYTFKRELRFTAKIPWVYQANSGVGRGSNAGLGDSIAARGKKGRAAGAS